MRSQRQQEPTFAGAAYSMRTFFKGMLYSLSRFLQLAGLALLPLAMAGDMAGKLDLKQMLTLSAVGIGVFGVGWLLQQVSRPK